MGTSGEVAVKEVEVDASSRVPARAQLLGGRVAVSTSATHLKAFMAEVHSGGRQSQASTCVETAMRSSLFG